MRAVFRSSESLAANHQEEAIKKKAPALNLKAGWETQEEGPEDCISNVFGDTQIFESEPSATRA